MPACVQRASTHPAVHSLAASSVLYIWTLNAVVLSAVRRALQRDRVQGHRLHARPGWQLWPQGMVDMI